MLIHSVELENFKSYEFAKIPFGPGVTAILGENGAGKSSILEAVGFVLFDHRNGRLSDLLREGAKNGRAAVTLISSRDGGEYVVEREFSAKTTMRYRVHQPSQANQILAEGVGDVQTWLRDHMGVPPKTDLGALFENTIGVPQGTFTAPFLLAPAQRKVVFDPLLEVEKYRKASDNLRPTVRQLKDQKVDLEMEIARMEGEMTVLPTLRGENDDLVAAIPGLELQTDATAAQISGLEARLEQLSQAEGRVQAAKAGAREAMVRVEGHEHVCEGALRSAEESEQAAGVVDENRSGHGLYLLAEVELQKLESSRQERQGLLDKRAKLLVEIARLDGAREEEARIQREVTHAEVMIEDVRAGLSQAAENEKEQEALAATADGWTLKISRDEQSIATAQAEIKRLTKQSQFVSDAATAICPTCGSELTPESRRGIAGRNAAGILNLRGSLKRLATVRAESVVMLRQVLAAQDQLRAKLRDLPSPGTLVRAQQNLAKWQTALLTIKSDLEGLSPAPTLLGGLDARLESFADLDERLAHWQGNRQQHKQAHALFVSHTQLAELYPERQAKLEALVAKRNELNHECDRLSLEYEHAMLAYDAEDHAETKAKTTALQQQLAGARAQLQEKRHRLEVVQASIERLEAVAKEVATKAATAIETREILSTIETVRDILREAGPYVTRRLVRQISQRASMLFSDLMGDSGRRLEWSEDYEVTLGVRGHQRTFSQLSGGEQMVAALAVRLGLLRETSAINIAFLDEPTSHLDSARRHSLAEQLARVKGFSQLFVISHDSTFDSAAQITIRIEKNQAGSHVCLDGG